MFPLLLFAFAPLVGGANVPFMTAEGVRRETADTLVIAKEVANEKEVRSAVWTTTALGVYRAYVNGRAREDAILRPGFTHPLKCRHVQTWDVTALMDRAAGARNVFAAEVTGGWYRDGAAGYRKQPCGTGSGFRGELRLAYADGSVRTVATDGSWRAMYGGPLRKADIFFGEAFDARIPREYLTNAAAFAAWKPAVTNREFAGELRPESGSPVVYREDLAMTPRDVTFPLKLKRGERLILDFGQNHAGVPEFTAEADVHTQLTLRFAEMLNDADAPARGCDGPRGSLYMRNYRKCPSRFDYWFRGGEASYRPSFSYWGYRYASVEASGPVTIKAIRSIPVSSISAGMECGTLETGDETLNRFISNVRWGMRSNFISVPTDCPQRDERQGWAGDIQVFAPAALYQARVAPVLDKWMDDFVDSVLPCGEFAYVAPTGGVDLHDKARFGFADAGIIVPWTLWRMTGDAQTARRCWPSMVRHLAGVAARRYETPANGAQFGDWLSMERWETNRDDLWATDDPDVRRWWRYLGRCYLLKDAQMMVELARALGQEAEARRFAELARTAKAELRREFFADDDLIAPFRDQQGAAAFALNLGLAPTETAERRIFARLAAAIRADGNRFRTGFLATLPLMDVLGRKDPELAYAVLLQHGCPGWLYAVDQGATTVWERWDSWTKERGFPTGEISSYNHFAYGGVVAWLYRFAAGIRPDPKKGGFRHFVLEPHPDRRLGSCDATYDSVAGRIRSKWEYAGGRVKYTFAVPEGTTATVILPDGRTFELQPGEKRL